MPFEYKFSLRKFEKTSSNRKVMITSTPQTFRNGFSWKSLPNLHGYKLIKWSLSIISSYINTTTTTPIFILSFCYLGHIKKFSCFPSSDDWKSDARVPYLFLFSIFSARSNWAFWDKNNSTFSTYHVNCISIIEVDREIG